MESQVVSLKCPVGVFYATNGMDAVTPGRGLFKFNTFNYSYFPCWHNDKLIPKHIWLFLSTYMFTLFSLFHIRMHVCVHACAYVHSNMCAPGPTLGDQGIICRSWFSLSTMWSWSPSSGQQAQKLYPQGYLTGPCLCCCCLFGFCSFFVKIGFHAT